MANYNWFVSILAPRVSAFADIGHKITGQEWTEDVQALPAAPPGSSHGTQHRVQWFTTAFRSVYHITAPGVGGAADAPDWHGGDFGIFPSSAEGKWGTGWSLIGPHTPTKFHFNGTRMLISEDFPPYQANRFADTDNLGLGLTLATGPGSLGGLTSLTIAPGTFPHELGYLVIVRPNTPQEEARQFSNHPISAGESEIQWAAPLVNGPVVANTPFMCRAQRSTVEQRPLGLFTGGPRTVKYRMEKVGAATRPRGNLWRDSWTGYWMPSLPGNYSVWKLSNEFDGKWRDVALIYLTTPDIEDDAQATGTIGGSILMEFHHYQNDNANDPSNLNDLANQPSDIRYSGMRIRDETGRWHEMPAWQLSQWYTFAPPYTANVGTPSGTFNANERISWNGGTGHGIHLLEIASPSARTRFLHTSGVAPIVGDILDGDVTNAQRTITSWAPGSPPSSPSIDNPTTEFNWGWDVHEAPGKLRHQAGLSVGEKADRAILLVGLTYENASSGAPLAFVAVQDIAEGAATYHGPVWGGGGPYIMQDSGRGWYICNPVSTTTPVRFKHVADRNALYRFTGDFALANPGNASGAGADVLIVSGGKALYSAHLPTGAVDPDDPFVSVTAKHFEVESVLRAGDVTYFTVTGTASGFDATAFSLGVSSVDTPRARRHRGVHGFFSSLRSVR